MSSKGKSALVVFSKGVSAGNVKTRLSPVLSREQRKSLHLALLQDTIAKIKQLKSDPYLFLDQPGTLPFETGIPIQIQSGADLGEKMANAFQQMLMRYEKVVIIGTDSPTLGIAVIQNAVDLLSSNDLVIGPSDDGGYYLIGLSKFISEIFHDIPWGTGAVLNRTLSRIPGRKHYQLGKCFDVDLPADLERLQSELVTLRNTAPHTCEWLQQWRNSRSD